MACSMSSASPPRHSPTTIRSGRMRSEFFTSSRMAICPLPSALAGRDSSDTRCSWCSCSSAASSMVTIRSPSGIKLLRILSSVVLPEPVPPETMMFLCCFTAICRNSTICVLAEPNLIKSSAPSLRLENLRIVIDGPFRASGGMMALKRDPSFSRASTSGELSSMRRPTGATMRSITPIMAFSLENASGTRTSRPARSTKISSTRLTMISVVVGSASSGSSRPSPMASSRTSSSRRCLSTSAGMPAGMWRKISRMACSVCSRNSLSPMRCTSVRRMSKDSINFSWISRR